MLLCKRLYRFVFYKKRRPYLKKRANFSFFELKNGKIVGKQTTFFFGTVRAILIKTKDILLFFLVQFAVKRKKPLREATRFSSRKFHFFQEYNREEKNQKYAVVRCGHGVKFELKSIS